MWVGVGGRGWMRVGANGYAWKQVGVCGYGWERKEANGSGWMRVGSVHAMTAVHVITAVHAIKDMHGEALTIFASRGNCRMIIHVPFGACATSHMAARVPHISDVHVACRVVGLGQLQRSRYIGGPLGSKIGGKQDRWGMVGRSDECEVVWQRMEAASLYTFHESGQLTAITIEDNRLGGGACDNQPRRIWRVIN